MFLSIKQIFGDNCTSDANYLIIQKQDLRLSPNTNNSAEQLLAAVVDKYIENFEGKVTTPSGELLTDENGRVISYDNSELYRSSGFLWERQVSGGKYRYLFVVEMDDL